MRDRRPTLTELEAFRAVVAEGTTAAAGRRLGTAQSSISRAIAELESRVGYPLFERRGRLIAPTIEALALNRELDPVFEILTRLAKPEDAAHRSRTLSIAAAPAFAIGLIAPAFAAFRTKHPGCTLRLEVVATPEIVRLVAEGMVEIGVTDSKLLDDNVRLEPFRQSDIVCLMPQKHRLSSYEAVAWSDLFGESFVALARRHSMRAQIEAHLNLARVDFSIVAETSTAVVALELIREGLGIGLLNPFPLLNPQSLSGLIVKPMIEPLTYKSTFVFASHLPPTPLAKRFQNFLTHFVNRDPWSRPS